MGSDDPTDLRRWNGLASCGQVHIENMADQVGLLIGDVDEEGGDIQVMEDAAGNNALYLDADAADLTIGNATTRLGLVTVWGEAGADTLDLQTGSTGLGTRLEISEYTFAGIGLAVAQIEFTDSLGGPYGALAGAMLIYDPTAADIPFIYLTDQTGALVAFLSFDPTGTFDLSIDNSGVAGDIVINMQVGQAFRAATDDNFDLGTAAAQWRDGYFDGTVYIDILSVEDNVAGEGVGCHLVPTADNTWDLGQRIGFTWYEWRHIYVDGEAHIDELILSTAANEGVGSHLIPDVDTLRDLGSATREFGNLYIDEWAYIDSLRIDVAFDVDPIDIAATGLGALAAVYPVTYGGGATGYVPIYDGYS